MLNGCLNNCYTCCSKLAHFKSWEVSSYTQLLFLLWLHTKGVFVGKRVVKRIHNIGQILAYMDDHPKRTLSILPCFSLLYQYSGDPLRRMTWAAHDLSSDKLSAALNGISLSGCFDRCGIPLAPHNFFYPVVTAFFLVSQELTTLFVIVSNRNGISLNNISVTSLILPVTTKTGWWTLRNPAPYLLFH